MSDEMHEKVARALCWRGGWKPDRLIVAGPLEGQPKWRQYLPDADAAITAAIDALIELEIPYAPGKSAELSAILTEIKPFLTKGDAQ